MNKSCVIGLFAFLPLFSVQARVNDPAQSVRDADENLVEKTNVQPKTDTVPPKQTTVQPTGNTSADGTSQTLSLQAYDNYDFVPGEKILFAEDFGGDKKGEFPAHWILCYGQGVVTDFDGKKVFALTEGEHGDNAVVMEPRLNKKSGYMPAAFTVEADIYVPWPENSDGDIRLNVLGLNFYGTDAPFDSYDDWDISPEQLGFYTGLLSEGSKQIPEGLNNENYVNKWHHIAIAYKNKQMKIYLDQNRLYVIPEVKDAGINKFGVRVTGKCVVTNIRLAEGGGMTILGQKFTDAKIVTHGINFDLDKSTIKPESMGTLNMIVQIMKDNPDLKFEIEGSTDNSGSAAHNLLLSQQRADAVKLQLVSMGISSSRLTTKGFGDTKPISDNTTPEGRANNRRVEFVKM